LNNSPDKKRTKEKHEHKPGKVVKRLQCAHCTPQPQNCKNS